MSTLTATSTKPTTRDMIVKQIAQRRRVDQWSRGILVALLTVTIAVYLIAPFLALSWMRNPFTGVFIEYPTIAIRGLGSPFFVESSARGTELDIQHRDLIVAVNGEPVGGAPDIYRALRDSDTSVPVPMDVIGRNGQPRSVLVTIRPMPVLRVFGLFALPYLIGLLYLGLGLWVYRNRRNQSIGRTFLLMCSSSSLFFATMFDFWTTHVFVWLWTAALPLSAALIAIFGLEFPNESQVIAERPLRRWLPIVPAAIGLIVGEIMLFVGPPWVVWGWRIQYILVTVSVVFLVGSLLLRSVFAPSPIIREQSRIVLIGSAVAFIPFIAWQVDPQGLQVGWLFVGFGLFPVAIAYSIVQYNVLDSERVFSFAATYSLIGLAVVVGYALLVAGLGLIFGAAIVETASSPAAIAFVAFLLVLGFQPIRSRLQELVDSFFFRTRALYDERLTVFRHDVTAAGSLSEVVRLLKTTIRDTLIPTHVYIFLRDAQNNDFIAVGQGSRPDTDIRFEPQSGLVHALSTARDLIFLEFNKPLPPELVEEHARLAVLRTPILSPLQGQDRLAGWVAVGAKRSGDRYTVEDLRFIQALAEQASLAVERAQVITDLERRVRELDVLSQVSQAVNFTTDPDVLMELIYTQTSKLVDTTNFYIIMRNEALGALMYDFLVESEERYPEREGLMWDGSLGLEAEVIRTGRPIRTDDYLAECARRNIPPKADSRHYAWMGVPLNAAGHTLGVMVVASYSQGVTFTDEQLKVFWAIADQAATALDKARLFNETERRAFQLATLNEISKELSSTLDLENLLNRIMRSAVDILGAEAGSIFLIDESTQELVFRVVQGGEQSLVGQRLPPGAGIVGEAALSKAPVIVNDVNKDRRWFGEAAQQSVGESEEEERPAFRTESLLAVPLLIQDESIGVLEVINKKDGSTFGDEDISLLTTFAAQAAVAIQNARLYQATDEALTARVDELQNLQRIDRELNRTLNFDRVISITLEWALRTTGASAGAIIMLEGDDEQIVGARVVSAIGYRDEWVAQHQEQILSLDHGIIGRVLSSGKPELIQEAQKDPSYEQLTRELSQTIIAVPILRANRPIGLLLIESHIEGLLSNNDFDFVQRLVEHAAVAIENTRLIQRIEQANKDKTDLMSFIAHELKNPMTSIRGYTDLIKGGGVGSVTDMQVQFLNTIRANVDRMNRLVSDLRDSALLDNNRMTLDKKPISVHSYFDVAIAGMRSQIEEKKQELVLEIEEDLPMVYADKDRMEQIVTNLISNANKYTPEGGRIVVGAKADRVVLDEMTNEKHDVVIQWVSDTGIGMSDQDLKRLFTKFFRTEAGKDMAKGTGLGLNITKSLIEGHNGRIWVDSKIGEGTTFTYFVPVYVPQPETAAAAAN